MSGLANLTVTELVAPNGDVIVRAECDWPNPAYPRYAVTSREWETTVGDVAVRTAHHRDRAITSLASAVAVEADRLAAKS